MTIKCQQFRDATAKKHGRHTGNDGQSKGKAAPVAPKYGDNKRSDKNGKRPNMGTTARAREQKRLRDLRNEVKEAFTVDLSSAVPMPWEQPEGEQSEAEDDQPVEETL